VADFDGVASGVDAVVGADGEGVDVKACDFDGAPVDDEAADAVVIDEDVFDADGVEDAGAGVNGCGAEFGDGFDGVGAVVAVAFIRDLDACVFKDRSGVFLDDDDGEGHAAAPDAAADGEFAFVDGDFFTCFGEVVGGGEAGGPCACDGDVDGETVEEFFAEAGEDGT